MKLPNFFRRLFGSKNTVPRISRNKTFLKSNEEIAIIFENENKLREYLERSRSECTTIEAYKPFEEGAVELTKNGNVQLCQYNDGLWAEVTNVKDLSEERRADIATKDGKERVLYVVQNKRDLHFQANTKRKVLQLVTQIEQLKIAKGLRVEFDASLKKMAEKLDFGINTRREFFWGRFFAYLGLVFCSISEAGNAYNSMEILGGNVIAEIATLAGIAISIVVMSKGLVYLYSSGNLQTWRIHVDPQTGKTMEYYSEPNIFDVGAFLLTWLAILFPLLLAGLRIDYMELSQDVTWTTKLFLYFLGLVLMATTIMLTIFIASPKGKIQALYNTILGQVRRTEKRIQKLQKVICRIRTRHLDKGVKIEEQFLKHYAKKIDQPLDKAREELLDKVITQNVVIAMTDKSKKELIHMAQHLMWESRGLMEEKTGNIGYKWDELTLTEILEEPQYQFVFNNNSNIKEDENTKESK